MKKLAIEMLTLFMFGITGLVHAQIPAEQTIKVNEEQVPMSVRVAIEKDFGLMPDDGIWMVRMIRTQQSERTITEAKWYSFNKRNNKKEKIEIRYSPEGELLTSKGVEQKSVERASR